MSRHVFIQAHGHRGTVHNLGYTSSPRKALLEATGYKHTEKIYVDKKDGSTVHTGYVVGGEWYTLYIMTPWEGRA